MRVHGPVLVLAAGCGLSEEAFVREYSDAACAGLAECATTDIGSVEDCVRFTRDVIGAGGEGCDYDGRAAAACVNDIEDADCATLAGSSPTESCLAVYTGDGCQWYASE
jgi:hypothetical protein